MVLPENVDGNMIIKTSELLVLILRDISNTEWRTPGVWITLLKNYVSNMKELSLEIGNKVRVFVLPMITNQNPLRFCTNALVLMVTISYPCNPNLTLSFRTLDLILGNLSPNLNPTPNPKLNPDPHSNLNS